MQLLKSGDNSVFYYRIQKIVYDAKKKNKPDHFERWWIKQQVPSDQTKWKQDVEQLLENVEFKESAFLSQLVLIHQWPHSHIKQYYSSHQVIFEYFQQILNQNQENL